MARRPKDRKKARQKRWLAKSEQAPAEMSRRQVVRELSTAGRDYPRHARPAGFADLEHSAREMLARDRQVKVEKRKKQQVKKSRRANR